MAYNPASEAKFLFELLDVDYDLSVVGFDVEETVSETFVINLTLAGREKIKFEDVKLQEGVLTVLGGVGTVLNDDSGDRYFHGIIRKFKHAGTSERLHVYEAQMVPSLWLLSLEEKCRIFQDKPLKEIIETLLDERDIASDMYEFRLARDDIFIKFSIQYQETNLHYLSRLLEHEGIFYFFEHFKDKHVLVFCDTDAFYQNITGRSTISFNTNGLVAQKENIYSFVISERLRPGKLLQKNFNFKTPSVDLTTTQETEIETDYEVYEYPGPYGETAKGDTMSQIRLEEIQALAKRGYGDSTCPRLQPGAVFTLTDHLHDDFNAEYFVYAAAHEGEQPQILQEHGSGGSAHYSNSFSVIPANVTFRPERISCKPMVPGLLSAIVTGPKGEEIWPDEYGRVHVQFHFDRKGKMDERSSCWLRTVQFWNGTTWGSQFIPRVGDEVLVSFINGDMDYPIIVGSAVNAAKMPNYSLPANKTQSGFRTKTHKGDGFHELRFDDAKGKEEIFLHSQKDLNMMVLDRKGETVCGDSGTVVGKNRDLSVGGDSYTVVTGKATEIAKEIVISADSKITIVSGASSIVITPEGIKINNAQRVDINDGNSASMPEKRPVSGSTGKGGKSGGGGRKGGSPAKKSAEPAAAPTQPSESAPAKDVVPPVEDMQPEALGTNTSGLGDFVSSGSSLPLLPGAGKTGLGDLVSSVTSSIAGKKLPTMNDLNALKNETLQEGRNRLTGELAKAKTGLIEKTGISDIGNKATKMTEKPASLLGDKQINPDDLIKTF